MTEITGSVIIVAVAMAVAIVSFLMARATIKDITDAYEAMLDKRRIFTDRLIEENKALKKKVAELEAREHEELMSEVIYG